MKSDLSLHSLEIQIILPSSVSKEYLGQNPFVRKPGFGSHHYLGVFLISELSSAACFYTLISYHVLIQLKSVRAALKLTYFLLSQIINMSLARCPRSPVLNYLYASA